MLLHQYSFCPIQKPPFFSVISWFQLLGITLRVLNVRVRIFEVDFEVRPEDEIVRVVCGVGTVVHEA